MPRVLIVEDDRDVAANIAEYFEPGDIALDFAYDGKAALSLAADADFDAIVMDLGLPRLDGVAASARLRACGCAAPILVLTARDAIEDKAAAFDVGADDYLVKPFALAELEMRLRALMRRQLAQGRTATLSVADLHLDTGTMDASRAGKPLRLNRSQRTILELLLRASPNVVSKSALVDALWGDNPPGPDALRTHLFELRAIVDKPFSSALIHTIHGHGYVLRALPAAAEPDQQP